VKKTGKPSSTPKQAADSGKQRTRRDDAPRRRKRHGCGGTQIEPRKLTSRLIWLNS